MVIVSLHTIMSNTSWSSWQVKHNSDSDSPGVCDFVGETWLQGMSRGGLCFRSAGLDLEKLSQKSARDCGESSISLKKVLLAARACHF